MRIALVALLALSAMPMGATASENLMPASVVLYEQHKAELPTSNFSLSLCKLLARNPGKPFFALPSDRGPETCDLAKVVLAFSGFCASGVLDAAGGVHFSQSLMPLITIVHYADGTVIYANNVLKTFAVTTDRDELAAIDFFQTLPHAPYDVRGAHLPLFPADWEAFLPLRKERP